ncbi:MAG TPA: cell division protein FtsA [Candidatus Manganitrophaceae bacterium]|nr:cell division protein FtsA [Candidatus Manganitrophaceae bacterium]
MAKRENILVGLDVGTTKICAIVGEIVDDKRIDIIGIGTHPSKGLKKGMVVNIESTVESIKRAVEEAELMAGVQINSVYTGIAGGHIKGLNSRGVIAVKDHEVSRSDIARVIDAAKAVAIPLDREILHVLPQEFIVDSQDGIKDPLGMSGVRLEAEVHIITGAVTSAQNIVKSVNRAGLEMVEIILQPLASSEAVLTADEKELGVAVVDIGGGTTDIATFVEGSVRHTAVLGIGGNHFTNDIAIGLRTPPAEAEKIKIRYGCASADLVKDNETIEVPSVGGRPPRILSRQILAEIIEPRAEEIFGLVGREIEKMGYEERVASGVVITGGSACLAGMVEVAERVLNLPVRRGAPAGVGGLLDIVNNPMYATGVGLILYAFRNQEKEDPAKMRRGPLFSRMKSQMKSWVKEFF